MIFRLLSLGLLAGILSSCSSVSNIAKLGKSKYRELLRPTPPVVAIKKEEPTEPRTAKKPKSPKKLKKTKKTKEVKSSEEQVIAYLATPKKKPGVRKAPAVGEFFSPDDFDAGALPTSGVFPSIGLLPPLSPGGNSSIETADSPDDLSVKPELPKVTPQSFFSQ